MSLNRKKHVHIQKGIQLNKQIFDVAKKECNNLNLAHKMSEFINQDFDKI